MKHILFLLLLFGVYSQPAFSQFYPTKYRPPNLDWHQLKTPHFNIVFPAGEDSIAYRTGRILEHEYPKVQELVGGELNEFPVVLNNYNDRSNGFVSSLHFRSEIEIPTIKGKTMNPQSGNWLETVAPHELVHALHYSHLNGIWANIIKLFSPDAARSIQGSAPHGIHEGIATYHETAGVAPEGGRGNYPYFNNQFNAVFSSPDRWSMGQMLSVSSYSRPFDRHYIGGYEFTNWLQTTYGSDATRDAIDFFIRWPFLGYGTALRHSTGYWPGKLYDQFEKNQENSLEKQSTVYDPLPLQFDGAEVRRPIWLNNEQLLIHGSFYNSSPGFYTYSLADNSLQQLIETRSVQDYNYDLSSDRSRLLFSNYRSSALYDNTFKTDLYEADLSSGAVKRLSTNLRGFAPIYRDNGFLALQTDHESSSLISLSNDSNEESELNISSRISVAHTEFVSVKLNPANPAQLAIVANRRGLQGLWIVHEDSIQQQISGVPDISFMEGSVFDPAWHPSGNRLMFTSDHTGKMQLYEYDLSEQEITQITEASFNAMEGSYGPDGEQIAFIIQQKNEHLPVVLDRAEFADIPVPADRWRPSNEKENFVARSELGSDLKQESKSWATSEYQPEAEWVLPRTIKPTASEISNSGTYEAGLSFNSNDLLQRNSYQFDVTYAQEKLWYDLTYRNKSFFPGLEFNVFSDPSFNTISVQDQSGAEENLRFLRQDVGGSFGIPTRFILENNVRYSVVRFTPSVKIRGTRFFELDHNGTPASEYANSVSANLFSSFNYRIQRNIRDLQPSSGLVLYSELEHSFSREATTIETTDYRIDVDFSNYTAWRPGLFFYMAPLKRWHQSLRLGIEGLTQTSPIFDNQNLVSNAFSEPVFSTSKHLMSINTRYTVPLLYPDKGGFFFPAYLSNLYLVGFSDTITDLDNNENSGFFNDSRTVIGLGLRTQFRISNLSFDLGVAIGYEPTRNKFNPFIGNF